MTAMRRLNRDLRLVKWGSEVSLRGAILMLLHVRFGSWPPKNERSRLAVRDVSLRWLRVDSRAAKFMVSKRIFCVLSSSASKFASAQPELIRRP